jgi:hypothetical protein
MADWSTMTTADLPAATQAASSGFAASLGSLRRRALSQQSEQDFARAAYNADAIARGRKELAKAKKSAVIGDIATLGTLGLTMIPGAGAAVAGILGTSPGVTAALMNYAPHLVGNLAGSPSPLVGGVANMAGDIRSRSAMDEQTAQDIADRNPRKPASVDLAETGMAEWLKRKRFRDQLDTTPSIPSASDRWGGAY